MAISGNIIIGNKDYSTKPSSNAPDVSGYQAITNKEKKKKKLRDSLDAIVANKDQSGSSTGIKSVPTMGKRTGKFKDIEDKVKSGQPLTEGEKAIASFYMSSAPNQYAANIQKFKDQPGGLEVFKEKFPNPLVKIAGGLGKFFEEGTLLGKFMSSLNKSDQNKVNIITNDPTKKGPLEDIKPAYDPSQFGLGGFYEDKILRDLKRANAIPGIDTNVNQFQDEGIMAGAEPYDASNSLKRRIVSQYYGIDVGAMRQSTIDKAYEAMMNKIEKERETNMMGASSPDYSNFQKQVVDEVVDDRYQAGPNEDNMMGTENIFNFDSSALSGSGSDVSDVSETEYKENKEVFPNQFPIVNNPDSPYADLFPDSYAEQMDNMATGGYMSSFPNQNLNTQSLSASDNIDDRIMKNLQFEKMSPGMMGYNAGGYAGMSTFDKLKMIADSGYQS